VNGSSQDRELARVSGRATITGLLQAVQRGDRDALADSLVRLLDDETLRARLGKTGRQEAQLYGWPRVTEAVLDVYAAVLGSTVSA